MDQLSKRCERNRLKPEIMSLVANSKNWRKARVHHLPAMVKPPSRASHCPIARSCASSQSNFWQRTGSFPTSALCRGDAETGWHC
jgi:hypothetical protein